MKKIFNLASISILAALSLQIFIYHFRAENSDNWIQISSAFWTAMAAIGAIVYMRQQSEILSHQSEIFKEQSRIFEKQVQTERVTKIWNALRDFTYFVVHSGKVRAGESFVEVVASKQMIMLGVTQPCKEYVALQEAFYLSKLVSEPLFNYMRIRMEEADGLQRVGNDEILAKRVADFHKNWDVYKMAESLRELS